MVRVVPSWRAALAMAAAFSLAACSTLPPGVERTESRAYVDTSATRLGQSVAPRVAAHPGLTGVFPVPVGREAFAARVLLARAAERSLDVQYFIWHADTSGSMLARALWGAAERGVRVRMLIDDANTQGEDDVIATLASHAHIEVRLFNPFANRAWRAGDWAMDFSRVNRRMHNKSFTADNQVAVVGGRNIGDEYLGADSAVAFTDLDVLLAGAAVQSVSAEFDAYWNSASAYPARAVVPPATPETVTSMLERWERRIASPEARAYVDAVAATPIVPGILTGTLAFDWVPARVIHDDPAKVLHPPDRADLRMAPRLAEALGQPVAEVDLVSPYFVPTEEGTAALVALADRGVKVRVLTNSLEATDVPPVYASYSKYREELLRHGVRLFELKRSAEPAGSTGEERETRSAAALHAKTFAVDRKRIFVGSFNLDPRSARLNTEMGVVLESATLASRLAHAFDDEVPRLAYEVRLGPEDQRLQWVEQAASGVVIHVTTPGTSPLRRFWIGFLSVLPIEWLL
ncbi:MAG TPA: phospholipase D family protein [Caldimonas sp.]|nr:phospholipase D family protein [Caldimonas sp.]